MNNIKEYSESGTLSSQNSFSFEVKYNFSLGDVKCQLQVVIEIATVVIDATFVPQYQNGSPPIINHKTKNLIFSNFIHKQIITI